VASWLIPDLAGARAINLNTLKFVSLIKVMRKSCSAHPLLENLTDRSRHNFKSGSQPPRHPQHDRNSLSLPFLLAQLAARPCLPFPR